MSSSPSGLLTLGTTVVVPAQPQFVPGAGGVDPRGHDPQPSTCISVVSRHVWWANPVVHHWSTTLQQLETGPRRQVIDSSSWAVHSSTAWLSTGCPQVYQQYGTRMLRTSGVTLVTRGRGHPRKPGNRAGLNHDGRNTDHQVPPRADALTWAVSSWTWS